MVSPRRRGRLCSLRPRARFALSHRRRRAPGQRHGRALAARRRRGRRQRARRSISPIWCWKAPPARRTRPDIAASFQKAAEQGDAVAALNLGLWFGKGGAGAPDEREAAKWMRLAADKLPMAQYLHGRMLAEGRGEEPDFEAARALFARAADSGLVDAEAALAEMMLNGRGGPRDLMGAIKLFQKAARGGHGGAMYALGALCAGGHGIPANLPLAQRWFKGAAELGNPHAQLMLSRYLSSGVAGEIDLAQARKWLEQAADQGLAEAQEELSAALRRDERTRRAELKKRCDPVTLSIADICLGISL